MTTENTYAMYPNQWRGDMQGDVLMHRASREEAAAKGWELNEADMVAATHVARADTVQWQESTRPLSALVAKAGELAL